MATLTITQNFGTSGLVSVHSMSKLIWTFQPTTDTKVITSELTIGSVVFNAIEVSVEVLPGQDIYTYELNVSDILKYFHNSFYHKDLPDEINTVLSELVKRVTITITGKEDGAITDTEFYQPYLSHGIKQIGDAYGSEMFKLDAQEVDSFPPLHYFYGYPNEVYFYLGDDFLTYRATIEDLYAFYGFPDENHGLVGITTELFDSLLEALGIKTVKITNSPAEKITSWTNTDIDIFISSGNDITGFQDDASAHEAASNTFAVTTGQRIIVDCTLTMDLGGTPTLVFISGAVTQKSIQLDDGNNKFYFDVITTGTMTVYFRTSDETSSQGELEFETVYIQDSAIELQINTLPSNCGGLYVRYLSNEGFYRFWLFNKYYAINQSQSKIGSIINSFDTMVGAKGRAFNMGYKDAFQKYVATSENVSKDNRKILMDIYTSPAVYLWTGVSGVDDVTDEALWVLVEIEGSHEIKEKKGFQNIQATIVLPELYTQKL